jgi:hypothetical protein
MITKLFIQDKCSSSEYYDFKTKVCLSKKTINETCSQDIPCRNDYNFECQNDKCQCIPLFPFWSTQQNKCKTFSNYNETCSNENECDGSKSLVCNSEAVSCKCPLNIGKNYCDCPKRRNGNESYWDGTSCVPARDFMDNCTEDYMCKGITEGTFCAVEEQHCMCDSLNYFNEIQEKCTSKLPFGEYCTQIDACYDEIGIFCIDNLCQCDSTEIWLNGKCSKMLSYTDGSCTTDEECEGNLICKMKSESCECPVKVANTNCDCPAGTVDNEFYWNGFSCKPAEGFNDKCLNSNSSYMCQTLTQGTKCILDSNGKYVCKCSSSKYFNFQSRKCENKLTFNDKCSQIDACRDEHICIGTCQCTESSVWIEPTGCLAISTYNQTCTSDAQCIRGGNLICRNTEDSCKCPLNVQTGLCDCPKRVYGNEMFWDGLNCVPAQRYGINCTSNYMCQTLTQNTTCIGPDNTCKCGESSYFSNSANKCMPHMYHYQPCNDGLACESGSGLSCQSSQCKCNETTHYWNGTDSISGNCVELLNYKNGVCINDNQCKGNLICQHSSSCQCPDTVSIDNCDCPTKTIGNEYYWDESDCKPALGINQACKSNYTCRTLTENTICIGSVCKCADKQYFNQLTGKCQSQMLGEQPCNQPDACRSDLGLSCLSGICKCTAANSYWNGSICQTVLSYNQGTCNRDSDCNRNLVCKTSGVSCNCGLNVGNSKCDCPVPKEGAEYYWNSTQSQCVMAGIINSTCSFNYTCQVIHNIYS